LISPLCRREGKAAGPWPAAPARLSHWSILPHPGIIWLRIHFWSGDGGTTMQQVTLDEAKTRLDDLIDAALRGDTVSIMADEKRAVQLVPIVRGEHLRQFGSAKGLIQMSDDFDAPLEDFKEYME
jgi:antitoxin (DNA-binding transcriptional repressor) of toxin-antitoxin stability system